MPCDGLPKFLHAGMGMTRFPPNVEQVTARLREDRRIELGMRRNDVSLAFLLEAADARHLARLLDDLATVTSSESTGAA